MQTRPYSRVEPDPTAPRGLRATPPAAAPAGPPPAPEVAPPSALTLGLLAGAMLVGAAVALITIPVWIPLLAGSLAGAEPKASWYLSRASAFVAFGLLWISMASGLLITNKMARVWPGVFTAFDLHQFTSLLGLGFAVFHALVLLLDRYITYNLFQVLVPFAASGYRPLETALGQIALYLSVLVTVTFYVRKQIGNRAWHLIHFLSYGVFALALVHGLTSGTDSGNPWISGLYWVSGLSLLALTLHRFMRRQAAVVRP
jgi:predicted ferric reductase